MSLSTGSGLIVLTCPAGGSRGVADHCLVVGNPEVMANVLLNALTTKVGTDPKMNGLPNYQELRLVPVGVQENANSCSIDLGNAVQFLLDAGAHAKRPIPIWAGG